MVFTARSEFVGILDFQSLYCYNFQALNCYKIANSMRKVISFQFQTFSDKLFLINTTYVSCIYPYNLLLLFYCFCGFWFFTYDRWVNGRIGSEKTFIIYVLNMCLIVLLCHHYVFFCFSYCHLVKYLTYASRPDSIDAFLVCFT